MKYKLATALVAMAFATPALAEDAVCYNCPPPLGGLGIDAGSDR